MSVSLQEGKKLDCYLSCIQETARGHKQSRHNMKSADRWGQEHWSSHYKAAGKPWEALHFNMDMAGPGPTEHVWMSLVPRGSTWHKPTGPTEPADNVVTALTVHMLTRWIKYRD